MASSASRRSASKPTPRPTCHSAHEVLTPSCSRGRMLQELHCPRLTGFRTTSTLRRPREPSHREPLRTHTAGFVPLGTGSYLQTYDVPNFPRSSTRELTPRQQPNSPTRRRQRHGKPLTLKTPLHPCYTTVVQIVKKRILTHFLPGLSM